MLTSQCYLASGRRIRLQAFRAAVVERKPSSRLVVNGDSGLMATLPVFAFQILTNSQIFLLILMIQFEGKAK
jgi:hypothetical protein